MQLRRGQESNRARGLATELGCQSECKAVRTSTSKGESSILQFGDGSEGMSPELSMGWVDPWVRLGPL